MTEAKLLGLLRERIGSPTRNDVSDDRLLEYVQQALSQLTDELEFRVVEDNLSLALVADQLDYALPSEVLTVLWVAHNEKRLEPVGLGAEDREQSDWRALESGTPTRFAIRGRRLYLLPPPDSSAVSDDGALSYSYVAAPAEMGEQGPTGLSDNDQWLLIYLAALGWCNANPSEMNLARIPGYTTTVYGPDGMGGMMAAAKGRWVGQGAAAAKHHAPRFTPYTGGRTGGAR